MKTRATPLLEELSERLRFSSPHYLAFTDVSSQFDELRIPLDFISVFAGQDLVDLGQYEPAALFVQLRDQAHQANQSDLLDNRGFSKLSSANAAHGERWPVM
jgi:hypothetical protein